MASKGSDTNQGGLMSSAGLSTYYDSEEEKISINPKTILLLGILISIVVASLNILLV